MSTIPATATLICQECGEPFARGRSKSYKAKFCPDCRGQKIGRPAGGGVTALPAPIGIPHDWFDKPEVTKKEIIKLGRKLAKEILVSPDAAMDDKLSVLRIAGRWDDEGDEDTAAAEGLRDLIRKARGLDAGPSQ